MINAYVGLPGSGKSYGVVLNVIAPALKEGREVWTNIPINHDAMIAHSGKTVTQFEIADIENDPRWFLDTLPKGAVCVLDEAWRLWPSGLKANKVTSEHKEYMAEIRHLVGIDGKSSQLVIVTQDLQQLASFARVLIETTYRSVKMSFIGQHNKFRIDIYAGAVTGNRPPKHQLVRQQFGKYKKEVYALYKSHTKSDTGSAGDETKIDTRNNVLKGGIFKLLPVIAVVAVLGIWSALGALRDTYHMEQLESGVDQAAGSERPKAAGFQNAVYRVPEQKTDQLFFFKGRDTWISFNMGNGKDIVYQFISKDNESFVELSVWDVRALGYSVTMINNCMVLFVHQETGRKMPVTCREEKERKSKLLGVDFAEMGT